MAIKKPLKMFINIVIVILSLTHITLGEEGCKPSPELCKAVKCPEVTEASCQAKGGNFIRDDPDKCQCCSSCVVIKGEFIILLQHNNL